MPLRSRRRPADPVWISRAERREREFLTESAEKRYRILLDRFPELLDKVAQKDIARYLGITRVALSRTRNRITLG
jgi:CRP-like cAMP-binding protein